MRAFAALEPKIVLIVVFVVVSKSLCDLKLTQRRTLILAVEDVSLPGFLSMIRRWKRERLTSTTTKGLSLVVG